MRAIIVLLLCSLCILQCCMFEDLELYSGVNVEKSIGIDIYVEQQGAPNRLFVSHDRGQTFSEIPITDLQFWAVNRYNEVLTVENNGSNYVINIRRPGEEVIQVGVFQTGDVVYAPAAGSEGEFYLYAQVSGTYGLYILPRFNAVIQPVNGNISTFSFTFFGMWAISLGGVTNLYIFESTNSNFYRSTDRGITFTQYANNNNPTLDIIVFRERIYRASGVALSSIEVFVDGNGFSTISSSPSSCNDLHRLNDRIYAISNTQLYYSVDGENWQGGATGTDFTDIGSDYMGRLYILSLYSFFVSDDGGLTLNAVNSTFGGDKIAVVSYKKPL